MEEIKVGEYIRTKQGTIVRIEDTEFDICFNLAGQVLYKNWICSECFYEEIVKHSKNIIDLIETGDYVNGIQVINILPETFGRCKSIELANHHIIKWIDLMGVKSIVTKETFARESYKMEE